MQRDRRVASNIDGHCEPPNFIARWADDRVQEIHQQDPTVGPFEKGEGGRGPVVISGRQPKIGAVLAEQIAEPLRISLAAEPSVSSVSG